MTKIKQNADDLPRNELERIKKPTESMINNTNFEHHVGWIINNKRQIKTRSDISLGQLMQRKENQKLGQHEKGTRKEHFFIQTETLKQPK